jgi:predicted RNA-binding Zn-ribbon protein involved in translation (DUF1610 family)
MFFIGIFGIQSKDKVIKEFHNTVCPNCGRLSRAELIETYNYFHIFFIPVYRWNFKYYIKARCCNSVYVVDRDYLEELKDSDTIDFDRVKDLYTPNVCSNCGGAINPGFSFCPHCGQQL